MADNMSTFKRFEKKYMMNTSQYKRLLNRIAPYTCPDEYDRYTICNIYYDNEDFDIINTSLQKPVYKEKLRVRSYGVPTKQSHVFLELKKKYKKEVFKRRVSMSGIEYERYIKHGIRPDVSQQVMGEIEYFISLYRPDPKVFLAYERCAFSGKDNPSLRITFDENIRYRKTDLSLFYGDAGTPILEGEKVLMEVKVGGAMPIWLCRALNDLEIYPISFSKYGYCYQNHMLQEGAMARAQKISTVVS